MNDLKRFDQVIFYGENMNEINTRDLVFSNLNLPSIPFENKWTGGEDGIPPVFVGAEYQQRPVNLEVMMFSQDVPDYYLLQSRIFEIFGYGTPFYIVKKYERGKRYRAILDSNFEIGRIDPLHGKAEVSFITEQLPFAESIGTTQDIQRDGINADSELWGFGMGLLTDEESHKYTHEAEKGDTFLIYNAGNVPIHPFEQELRIDISNVYRSTNFFELNNLTNGSTFKITEQVSMADVITLDGANIWINNLEGLRRTNRKYIQLDPGWNVFSIAGANSAEIMFDFPFYYK
ncbi:phage tail domain-containing protein [Oceanobacillus sp. J11TS1]|uniref:phage tail domain-containing protein n=1 Tax=Oceanobacillus sp. J11TS1 TaxID=2807191 RepID=UPI001AFE6599|nr:phage tail domain-containing protein [Oceanobacillus sp. J11TS1]GIO25090.1 hypothetical protein J11TS1_36710 [Oceanobacillus sp. J11TS1]